MMTGQRALGRFVMVAAILAVASAGLAYAQLAGGGGAVVAHRPVQEFTHQEVQAAAVVATLNDLSKQGWEVVQIIPSWTIKSEDGTTELHPKFYEVFARRPMSAFGEPESIDLITRDSLRNAQPSDDLARGIEMADIANFDPIRRPWTILNARLHLQARILTSFLAQTLPMVKHRVHARHHRVPHEKIVARKKAPTMASR